MKSDYRKIEGYYDKYGSWYDDERIEGYYSFINDIEVGVVEKYGKKKNLLEVGCGTGIILNRTSKFSKSAIGVDLSEGMLKAAKRKGLKVQQANACNIPFESSKFDLTYSFKVLAHVPEIKKAIEEIKRVTNKNGMMVLEFYSPFSIKAFVNKLSGGTKKVYIRYDSFKNIREYLGNDVEIVEIVGARIITPFSYIFKIPLVGRMFSHLEKLLSNTILNRFAGYLIVVCKFTNK